MAAAADAEAPSAAAQTAPQSLASASGCGGCSRRQRTQLQALLLRVSRSCLSQHLLPRRLRTQKAQLQVLQPALLPRRSSQRLLWGRQRRAPRACLAQPRLLQPRQASALRKGLAELVHQPAAQQRPRRPAAAGAQARAQVTRAASAAEPRLRRTSGYRAPQMGRAREA